MKNLDVFKVSITRETGLLSIGQYDKDEIEFTREQAKELAMYILNNEDKITTTEEFYKK